MRSWTIGIMVIVLISTPLYQASAEDDIMINEVELNPKGYDKYTDVEEWVELYNAGNEPVDVSGWTLSSTSGRAVVFAIQSGIIIPADGYIKFGSGSQWLDNSGEVVVLRDLDGIIVDQVGPFDDDTGTNSWQRSPDGSSNWVFRAPTPEAPNGGEVTNQTEVQKGTSLTLDPPRSSVKLGDVVTFTGQLLTVDSEAIEGVTIWIKDNDPLATDDVLGTGKTNTNGEFAIEWIVEYDPDDTVNGYAVFEGDSSYGRSRSSEYTIIIFSELVPSSKLPILVLERPPEQVAAGDVIKFRGKLTEPNGRGIPGIKIIIKEDPLGADIALASGSTDNRGEFSIRWGAKLGKDNNEDDGSESLVVYAIFKGHSRFEKAESDRFTITIPFETTPSETTPSETTPAVTTPLETIPIKTLPTDTLLDLEVSPRKVLPGDQVIFEGRLVNLDREPISDATVEIMVVRTLQDDTLTTVVTDLDGSFRTLSSIQSSDQDMVVVYAQYQDGKVTAKSLYRQFAVVQSLPEYNIAELLICNIRQDEPFLIEEEGDTNQAKGLRGEVGILLRMKSQDVDVGQSLSVPFKADPGKLIINIVKENGDVATLAVVGDTPLNASPSIDGLTEVSSHFSVVLTPTGSASIEPTKLEWGEWGIANVKLDALSSTNAGGSVDILASPSYHLKAEINSQGIPLGLELEEELHCEPDFRTFFNVGGGVPEPVPPSTPPTETASPEVSDEDNNKVSAVMKLKKRLTLLALKNSDEFPVYGIELESTGGNIKFVKAKGWDRERIDSRTTFIETADRPVTEGRNQLVLLIMDDRDSGLIWRAFDADHNILAYGVLIP